MGCKFSMNALLFSVFFSAIFLFSSSKAQTCSFSFSGRTYATCVTLPVLNAFLHWTYHQSNHSVDIAYRHTQVTASNWVAWALNPSGGAMPGAQCLVAFTNSSGVVQAYTSPISAGSDYTSTQLGQGPLSFQVSKLTAESGGNQMTIFATIMLPSAGTSFTQVWQHGDVSGNMLQAHPQTPDHLRSFGLIDFSSGVTTDTGASSRGSIQRRKNVSRARQILIIFNGLMVYLYLHTGSWSSECGELGDFDPYWSHDCKVLEGLQGREPGVVLPARCVPNFGVYRGSRRLGHGPQARQ